MRSCNRIMYVSKSEEKINTISSFITNEDLGEMYGIQLTTPLVTGRTDDMFYVKFNTAGTLPSTLYDMAASCGHCTMFMDVLTIWSLQSTRYAYCYTNSGYDLMENRVGDTVSGEMEIEQFRGYSMRPVFEAFRARP